jgi:hypothetical protein
MHQDALPTGTPSVAKLVNRSASPRGMSAGVKTGPVISDRVLPNDTGASRGERATELL